MAAAFLKRRKSLLKVTGNQCRFFSEQVCIPSNSCMALKKWKWFWVSVALNQLIVLTHWFLMKTTIFLQVYTQTLSLILPVSHSNAFIQWLMNSLHMMRNGKALHYHFTPDYGVSFKPLKEFICSFFFSSPNNCLKHNECKLIIRWRILSLQSSSQLSGLSSIWPLF